MNKQIKGVLKILIILIMMYILGAFLNWGYKSIFKHTVNKNTNSVESVENKK
jgi:hypothetical protein